MRTPTSIIERYIPADGKNHHWPQALAVLTSALGSLSCLSLVAWTSPSIPILMSDSSHIEPITLEEASYFTLIPPITTVVFSPFLSMCVDGIGRQKSIMLMALIYCSSWVLIFFADSLPMLYLSRVMAGVGDAALFTSVPIYVGEVTEPVVRGFWGNFIALNGFLGQFVINVVGSYFDIQTTALILSCIPLVQFVLMAFMPESPYYLLMNNRIDEARTSLRILRWKGNVEEELKSLGKDVQRQVSESGSFKDLFTISTNRKALFIAIGIRGAQQLSGLPAFSMYTQYIFGQAGNHFSSSTSAIIFTGVFLVVITGFVFIVHKFGRKTMMTFSCFTCGIVLIFEAAYFYIFEKTEIDVSGATWVPLAGMMVYVFTCASGLATIPTLMLGELFSASIKGKAMAVLNMSFSLYVMVAAKLFQSLSSNFGMYVPFCVFSACCFLNVVFSYLFVPETKGKTLEEIQEILRGRKCEHKVSKTMKEDTV